MINANNINNWTAPVLLIAAMIILILFQGVFPGYADILYADGETETEDGGDFIIYNNIKYKPDKFFIFTVILNICAFLLPAVFYVRLKGAGYTKNLKLDLRPGLRYLPLLIYMLFALLSGTVLLNSLMVSGSGEVSPENMLPFIINTGGNPVYDIGVLISFVMLPAFCEEFFFRSVLSAEYEKYGFFCAFMITSAAFAMTRFSLRFFLPYLFAGMVFYILAKITYSVMLAVILHAGYNFFNIYLWDKLSGVLNFEQNRFIFIFITAIIFMGAIYFVLNSLEIIYYKKAYNNEPSPVYPQGSRSAPAAGVRFIKSLFSPVFIAAAVIFLVYINI